MAKDSATATQEQGNSQAANRMEAARAAKRKRDPNAPILSDEENFSLRMVQNASKACKMVSKRIRAQQPVPPEILQACSALSGSLASILYD